jgi:hypothetical protein
MKTSQTESENVFREDIKEHRGDYFVVYKPADATLSFATVALVFPNDTTKIAVVDAMEHELEYWLKRFAVPVMISSFDARDDVIRAGHHDNAHLMGYVNPQTGKVVKKWGLFRDEEMPEEQAASAYLKQVYKDVPFRWQEEVRTNAERQAQSMRRALSAITIFVVAIPLLIEIIKASVEWIDHVFAALSIFKGLHEAGKAMGWLKPSRRKQEEDAKKRKMEHYFYHCEKNPEAFTRLKIENFRRESVERTRKEAEEVKHSPNKL